MNVRIEASINVAEQYDFYIDPGNNNNAQVSYAILCHTLIYVCTSYTTLKCDA